MFSEGSPETPEKVIHPAVPSNIGAIEQALQHGFNRGVTLELIDGPTLARGNIYYGQPSSVLRQIHNNFWGNVQLLLDHFKVRDMHKIPEDIYLDEYSFVCERAVEYHLSGSDLLIREAWKQIGLNPDTSQDQDINISYTLSLVRQPAEFTPAYLGNQEGS